MLRKLWLRQVPLRSKEQLTINHMNGKGAVRLHGAFFDSGRRKCSPAAFDFRQLSEICIIYTILIREAVLYNGKSEE